MALTEIKYGSLASSEIMNNNFNYLENKISEVTEANIATQAGLSSNIANINSSIASMNEQNKKNLSDIHTSLDKIKTIFSERGAYTTKYVNGKSWYIEYFSDEEKKNRIWIEQAGSTRSNSSVTFLKEFENENYTLLLGTHCTYFEGGGISSKNNKGFSHSNGKGWNYEIEWFASGK